eukprot:SAG22_NODE_17649_length_301_cov_0.742574_1_plen_29_part_10
MTLFAHQANELLPSLRTPFGSAARQLNLT